MDKTKAVELLQAYFGKTINFSYEIVKQNGNEKSGGSYTANM